MENEIDTDWMGKSFERDGFCGLCIHRDCPIDECRGHMHYDDDECEGENRTGVKVGIGESFKPGTCCKGYEPNWNLIYRRDK